MAGGDQHSHSTVSTLHSPSGATCPCHQSCTCLPLLFDLAAVTVEFVGSFLHVFYFVKLAYSKDPGFVTLYRRQ